MNKLPQIPLQNRKPIASWLRKIRESVLSNTPLNPNTIRTNNGWYTSIGYNVNSHPMKWKGEYQLKSPYTPGDVVYINDYYETTVLNEYSITTTVYTVPGVYVCTFPVPLDFVYTNEFTSLTDTNLISFLQSLNKRSTYVCYAPLYPYPLKTPDQVTKDQQAKYWHLIAFGPQVMSVCSDGDVTNYYVNSAQSGSVA